MSARRRSFFLTPEARTDLSDISLYTEQQWGKAQQRSYNSQLKTALAQLARFPNLGLLRPDLGSGVRAYRVGQHVNIYQPSATDVLILRLIHVRRDLDTELG
jgi:toxin ParE1/3/4